MKTNDCTYETEFFNGKKDMEHGKEMTLPSTMGRLHAYRGYMDGWSGRDYCPPIPASYNIDRLHEKGMVTVH